MVVMDTILITQTVITRWQHLTPSVFSKGNERWREYETARRVSVDRGAVWNRKLVNGDKLKQRVYWESDEQNIVLGNQIRKNVALHKFINKVIEKRRGRS